jgi:2,4-dienoyl-CoA reductase-like NADH-dependent reductase (Old Yellow Enzyme family)
MNREAARSCADAFKNGDASASPMVDLFKPYRIGELEIRNRFIRSATTSAWSDEHGVVRDEMIRFYGQLTEGGVGLIIKGHLYIDPRGKAHIGMAGIHDDSAVPKLKELTDAVHSHGGAILAQINYGGYQASAGERMGPSDYKGKGWEARAMTPHEIWDAIERFGAASERAIRAGFDGVQLHAAHGYLISEFLSKHANTRTDEWGGDLKNRMRLLREVYLDIRGRLGSDAVISMKMNCDDFSVDGFTVDESAQVAHAMAALGIDMIEVSGGGIGGEDKYRGRARHTDPALSEPSFAGHCEKIRATTKPKTLALVNGFRTRAAMQAVVDRGVADLISMSRPFIREPDLVKRLQEGQGEVSCIRCDACGSEVAFSKEMLRCRVDYP